MDVVDVLRHPQHPAYPCPRFTRDWVPGVFISTGGGRDRVVKGCLIVGM